MKTKLKIRRITLLALLPLATTAACNAEHVQVVGLARGVSISDQDAQRIAEYMRLPQATLISTSTGSSVEQMIRSRWAGTGHEEKAVRVARCESGLNPHAQNRRSSAYGIFQFLNSTWKSTGISKTSDPALQVEAAYRLWRQRGWQPWVCKG